MLVLVFSAVYAVAQQPVNEELRSKSEITVEKTLHMENAQVRSISYTSKTGLSLIESVIKADRSIEVRKSDDNGKTWKKYADWPEKLRSENGIDYLQSEPSYYLDPDNGFLIEFVVKYENRIDSTLDFGPNADRDPLVFRSKKFFYRISEDGGTTWGKEIQIIQKGRKYNADHWCESIWYGKNGGDFNPLHIVKFQDGSLVIPMTVDFLGKNGKFEKLPDRFGDVLWPNESNACLIGKWSKDGKTLEWDMSNEIRIDESLSYGLCEGSVAQVDDGKLMMVQRGCTSARQTMSGVKFFSISKDNGKTWGPAVPLTYPNGDLANSPASMPWLFKSSKNDRVYLIANILPNAVRQSDPRHPLQIMEIDKKYFWIKPESVTIIADREPQHPKYVRFSNWTQIEDRETGNLWLFMTEARIDDIFKDEGKISPHAYRFEIRLPEGK